jgi:plastocyanin
MKNKLFATLGLSVLVVLVAVGAAVAKGGTDDPVAHAASHPHHDGDHGGREPGEDVRGNCDEAEHANDDRCAGSNAASAGTVAFPKGTSTARRLVGTVGPGYTINLKTPGGASTVPAGTYTIVVRDASGEHNFHLRGPGVDKWTAVGSTGTKTWRVKLARGTYRVVCDPHADMMRGTLRVT